MTFAKKAVFSVLLFFGVIAAGFVFLLRGCLSKYDERSALPGLLYFEKGDQRIIFSIVKFEKATSYSQKGGITSKSVSTNYFIQTNDAATAGKLAERKIKHHRDIKNHPVETLGSSNGLAWVFMNEIMAFDPFTLEQVAGLSELEQKNPPLKGKFPAERRYYVFDGPTQQIFFTAKDGSAWKLDTKTLLASATDYTPGESPANTEADKLEQLLKHNQEQQDSLYEQKMRRPSRLLASGQISRSEYNRVSQGFNEERSQLYKQRDSLRQLKNMADKEQRGREEIQRKIQSLQQNSSVHFSQLKTNADTMNNSWYGLYSMKEMDKLYDRFSYQSLYDETARRQLYTTNYASDRNDDIIIAKNKAALQNGSSYFLDGGFLLSKQTGRPVLMPGPSFLVVHKDQVGNEGKIQISHVNADGKVNWTFDSQLKEWANYIFTGRQLIIIGSNNKELSSSDCNLLWCIDIATGKASGYDYFTSKLTSKE